MQDSFNQVPLYQDSVRYFTLSTSMVSGSSPKASSSSGSNCTADVAGEFYQTTYLLAQPVFRTTNPTSWQWLHGPLLCTCAASPAPSCPLDKCRPVHLSMVCDLMCVSMCMEVWGCSRAEGDGC